MKYWYEIFNDSLRASYSNSIMSVLQVAGISRVGNATDKIHYMFHGPHYLRYVLRLWSSRNNGK